MQQPTPQSTSRLAAVEAFRHLAASDLAELERTAALVPVARGQVLVRQGEAAEDLYLVVSGRFRVHRREQIGQIAEIGAGSPIGEIAFFAGGARTASVTAERDSLVLRLKRADFDRLAERSPQIWGTITAQLARRLASTTAAGGHHPAAVIPRTITLCRAGGGTMPDGLLQRFAANLQTALGPQIRSIVLDASAAMTAIDNGAPLESSEATQWFNTLEARYHHIIYVADDELSDWTKKAIRQADLVLCVAQRRDGISSGPNLIEHFAESLHGEGTLRLVSLHGSPPPYCGTRVWLAARPWLTMQHHIAPATHADGDSVGRRADIERLARFIRGNARGLVACGGGAFSAAHIGIFEALTDAGIVIDAIGGTSGGAAMGAAFALGVNPDDITQRTHDMFVKRKAMRRWTWPRYSLLDHTQFDRSLAEHFTAVDIEDLETPYFAVTTNLSRNCGQCLRSGPLWHAIRASAAIPALLPPVFTEAGEMLVDGCLVENVPIKSMQAFKSGPNVIVDFHTPSADAVTAQSVSLPARTELVLRMMSPGGRGTLPKVPGPQSVLLRALMLNRPNYETDLGPHDVLLSPTIPKGISHLDWHRHQELRTFARDFTGQELERLKAEGHPLLSTETTTR